MAEIIAVDSLFERFTARQKKFREVIVVVHHYGGNRHSFLKHIAWLNEFGFDVVCLDLPMSDISKIRKLPMNRHWQIGLRHLWADKIEQVLGSLSEKKILLSFSFPSASVFSVIARRHGVDVQGWVCEGGPFLHLNRGFQNLSSYQSKDLHLDPTLKVFLKNRFGLGLYGKLMAWTVGARNYEKEMSDCFQYIPEDLPILSIHDGDDKLVQSDMIDDFFRLSQKNISLETLHVPHATHLQSFSADPETYKTRVGAFLKNHGSVV